jgi:hypothetical protein
MQVYKPHISYPALDTEWARFAACLGVLWLQPSWSDQAKRGGLFPSLRTGEQRSVVVRFTFALISLVTGPLARLTGRPFSMVVVPGPSNFEGVSRTLARAMRRRACRARRQHTTAQTGDCVSADHARAFWAIFFCGAGMWVRVATH